MLADEQAANMIEATVRMIGNMPQADRERWLAIMVELACTIPDAKQAVIDAAGRYEF